MNTVSKLNEAFKKLNEMKQKFQEDKYQSSNIDARNFYALISRRLTFGVKVFAAEIELSFRSKIKIMRYPENDEKGERCMPDCLWHAWFAVRDREIEIQTFWTSGIYLFRLSRSP